MNKLAIFVKLTDTELADVIVPSVANESDCLSITSILNDADVVGDSLCVLWVYERYSDRVLALFRCSGSRSEEDPDEISEFDPQDLTDLITRIKHVADEVPPVEKKEVKKPTKKKPRK